MNAGVPYMPSMPRVCCAGGAKVRQQLPNAAPSRPFHNWTLPLVQNLESNLASCHGCGHHGLALGNPRATHVVSSWARLFARACEAICVTVAAS